MKLDYLVKCNGRLSGTKTLLTVGGILVVLRWALGGVTLSIPGADGVSLTLTQISGLDAAGLLSALGFVRGYSSSTLKGEKQEV